MRWAASVTSTAHIFIFVIDLIWKFSSGGMSIPILLVLGLVSTVCDWEGRDGKSRKEEEFTYQIVSASS